MRHAAAPLDWTGLDRWAAVCVPRSTFVWIGSMDWIDGLVDTVCLDPSS